MCVHVCLCSILPPQYMNSCVRAFGSFVGARVCVCSLLTLDHAVKPCRAALSLRTKGAVCMTSSVSGRPGLCCMYSCVRTCVWCVCAWVCVAYYHHIKRPNHTTNILFQEKEGRWQDKLREWTSRLEQSIANEQRLLAQIQALSDDKRLLQTRVKELNSEKAGLQRKVRLFER